MIAGTENFHQNGAPFKRGMLEFLCKRKVMIKGSENVRAA